MLHILLGLLKIIGIILAVIVGVVLLIVFIVLFAAFRYEIQAATDGNIKSLKAEIKFSWLFQLISGFVIYRDEKLEWQVKIAWKNLNVPQEETVIEETDVSIAKEKPDVKLEQKNSENSQKFQDLKKIKKIENTSNHDSPKKNKKKEPLIEKIKCSIQKISGKMKEINSLKETVLAYLNEESHKKAFQKLLKEIIKLLKKLKPKKLKANVEFGFEDPYKTGSILAYASMLYPFYGDNVNIKPDFEESIIKGDVVIKGRIKISYFANMGFRLILNKNIRLTIKDTMKLIAKK